MQTKKIQIMAEETLEQRLAKLYAKRDFVDRFNEDDVKTLIDAIRDAREHGGTASVDITPLSGGGGYTITITDSEGTEHTATVKDGGDAYEVYVSTVPQDQTPMSKAEWLASLKGDTGNDGSDGHNPCLGRFTAVPSTFAETPRAGDYYYVDTVDNTTTPPTVTETKIYKYDGTQWDSGTVVDVSNLTFNSGESVTGISIDGTGLANPAPNALAKAGDVSEFKISLLGGESSEEITTTELDVVYEGKYINSNTGYILSAENAIILGEIKLKEGDHITASTSGTGFALIAYRDSKIGSLTNPYFTVISSSNSVEDFVVETAGFYYFSGRRNYSTGNLSVLLAKMSETTGEIPQMRNALNVLSENVISFAGAKEYVDGLMSGERETEIITLDDINGAGALINYYLNRSTSQPAPATNTIITKPVLLKKGDTVRCQTGGTGFAFFAKSSSAILTESSFTAIAQTSLTSAAVVSYEGVIEDDGWYVFSGRINRTDETNLVVNITKYTRGKTLAEKLDEKVDKRDVADVSIPSIGLSIGADSVKDAIPNSPWFDEDSNSNGFDYGTYLDDKLDSVPDGRRFIFITDYHSSNNMKHSAELIDYARRRLGIKTILHGGDLHNEHDTAEAAAQDWLTFNRKFVFRIGNDFKQILGDHDRNAGSDHQPISYEVMQHLVTGYNANELTFDDGYDEMVAELGWSPSDMSQYDAFKKMHYYFDDVTIKTRFICLVTRIIPKEQGLVYDKLGDYDSGVLLLQMDFLYSSLMSMPKGYNVVVVGHNVVGDKSYTYNNVSRYNVNEPIFKGYWANVTKQLRSFINKEAVSTSISYLDWQSESIGTKTYDFSNAPDVNVVFCLGGDVHWDIMAKSQLVNGSEILSTVEEIALPSTGEPTVATVGAINKSTDILHVVTMTDGGDRGYRGIVEAPGQDYNDSTDSFRICKANTAGTIDSQAFDIVTIAKDGIYLTRIGSGFDRKVIFD